MGCKFSKVCRKTIPCRKKVDTKSIDSTETNLHDKETIQEEPQLRQIAEKHKEPKKNGNFYRLIRRLLRRRRKEKEHEKSKCLEKVIEDRKDEILSDPTVLPDPPMSSTDTSLHLESITEWQKESHPIELIELSDNDVSEEQCFISTHITIIIPEPEKSVPQFPVCEEIVSIPELMEIDPKPVCEEIVSLPELMELAPQLTVCEDNISVIELVDIPSLAVICEESDSSELPPEEFVVTSDSEESTLSVPAPEEFSMTSESEESDSSELPPEEFVVTSDSEESLSIIELVDIPPTMTIIEESKSSVPSPEEFSIASESEESLSIIELVDIPPTTSISEESKSSVLPPEEFSIASESEDNLRIQEVVEMPPPAVESSATSPVPITVCPAPEVCEHLTATVEEAKESDHRAKYILVQEAEEMLDFLKPAESSKPVPESSECTIISSSQVQKEQVGEVKAETPDSALHSKECERSSSDEQEQETEIKCQTSKPALESAEHEKIVPEQGQKQQKREVKNEILKPSLQSAQFRRNSSKTPKPALSSAGSAKINSDKGQEKQEKKVKDLSPRWAKESCKTIKRIMVREAKQSLDNTKSTDPHKPTPDSIVRKNTALQEQKKRKEETVIKISKYRELTPRSTMRSEAASRKPVQKEPSKALEGPKYVRIVSASMRESIPVQKQKEQGMKEQVPMARRIMQRNILPTAAVSKSPVKREMSKQLEPPKCPVASSVIRETVPAQRPKRKEKEGQVSCRIKITPSLPKTAVKKIPVPKDLSKPQGDIKCIPDASTSVASSGISKAVPVGKKKTQRKKKRRRIKNRAKKGESKKCVEKDSSITPKAPTQDAASSPDMVPLQEQIAEVKDCTEKVLEPVKSVEVVSTIPVKEVEKSPESSDSPSGHSSCLGSDLLDQGLADQKKEATANLDSITEHIPQGASNTTEDDDSAMEWTYITREKPLIEERVQLGSDTCFKAFTLDSVLGSGGFGKVYLAKHTATKKMFAIKALPKKDINKFTKSNLRMELRVLKMVTAENHQFLTGLSAYFQTDHHICLVMDYAAQGSLMLQLIYGPFSLKRTRFCTACIVLGLQFLHNKDIVHRDLKLGNVLLDASGYVKITDFGLSEHISTYRHGILSRAISLGLTNARALDWQAVGVMIYQMLEGYAFGITATSPQSSVQEFPESFTSETCRILKGLLDTRTTMRLGASPRGAEEVKKSNFFMNLDWEALLRKEVKPPADRIHKYAYQFIREPASTLDSPEEPLPEEIQKEIQEIYKNLENSESLS